MTSQNPDEAARLRIAAERNEFLNLHEIVAKARQNLNQNEWDYIVGGVETETTLRRNRMALDSIAFRPRVLRDVSKVDTTTEILGRKLRLPILLCPVGSLESFHPGGATPVVKAAAEFGVAHMLSSVCDPGLEGVAEAAPDALRIFQLYVRGDEAWVDDYVERAIANKYTAFCLTVDTAHYSRRERDIAKRHITGGRRRASGRDFQAALDWRTVERIKRKYKIPLGIKGIATAEDAKIALDHGVEMIYISNHGGRQLDHGRGSTDVLPEVAEAVARRALIVVDGGFFRGSDIVKAMALGANLVGLGRMQCYGLAAAGQAGVERMLELMEDEVMRSMGLLGATSYGKLDSSCLHAAAPANLPSVLSAFPHLDIAPYRY
jgi:glycolate oxidase